MTGRLTRALMLPALVVVLAGCGGGGGSGASSDPGSSDYDPAQTTLKDAGLEVCSEVQEQAAQGLDSGAGVVAVRAFYVAKDCMGAKTSPNKVILYQFDGRSSLDAGMSKIRVAYPRGEVVEYGPVIIVVTGPDAVEYSQDIKKALPQTSTTSTG
jgi:hypothetical protein